ncbi:MAG: phenylphosphate carboxylase subunit delta [Deltaproteobacteria bacterium]|nr:MAG: phenylphosphate carboxylase subunit delta [Deltaproteobacteria bacterium]RLC22418.1 MAG: phenylphosphate carboxylase subunit delta [Deltaproteobacteria bacterium]
MKNKLSNIELLLLDVDGVLTDGSITYSDSGEQIKSFNSKDGLGLRLLMDSGIKVGIITGRKSNALKHRCQNLDITLLFDGVGDKLKALDSITSQTGIALKKMAFAGDDLIDLPVMKKVGISFSVCDASSDVKNHSDIVTRQKGGHGAVREICETILKAKGLWDNILNKYLT